MTDETELSTAAITTVLHAIEKIESLRRTDEAVDALVDVLTAALSAEATCRYKHS
jgi:hypothetical protein